MFFMSEESNCFEPIDRNCEFAQIENRCKDGAFDFITSLDSGWSPSAIKAHYDTPFSEWYGEYALLIDYRKVLFLRQAKFLHSPVQGTSHMFFIQCLRENVCRSGMKHLENNRINIR